MVAPTVNFSGVVQTSADSTTNWSTGNLDTDSETQGTGCIGAKVSNSTTAFVHTGTSRNFNAGQANEGDHVFIWLNCLTPSLDLKSNGGLRLRIGDGTNTSDFYVGGDGTEADDPYRGGWRAFAVDPTGAADATSGTVSLAGVTQYGGVVSTIAGIMGNFNNGLVDQISVGTGLELLDGDATTPGTFQDFADADEGTKGNRYGAVRTSGGAFFFQGKVLIGDGATTTLFEDSNQVVIWEDNPVATDFYEFSVLANATATLGIISGGSTSGGCALRSAGTAKYSVSIAGTLNFYASTFDSARIVTLNANSTLQDSSIINSGQVSQNGAIIDNCLVSGGTDTIALQLDTLANFSGGTLSGNNTALKLPDGAGPYTITGTQFSGNTTDIEVNSASDVTVNMAGGANAATCTNIGAGTCTIVNSISWTISGMQAGDELTIVRTSDDFELFHVEASATGTEVYGFDGALSGTGVTVLVMNGSDKEPFARDLSLPSSDSEFPVTQTDDRVYDNPV